MGAGTRIKRKIILLGDGAVGKTSLIKRFVFDQFDDKYLTTIGTKITKKVVEVPLDTGGNVEMTMMIWDVLGQKGFQSVQSKAYQKAAGAVLVCDVTRKDTLQSLQDYWIPNLQEVAGKVPIIFLANKVDLLYSMDYSMKELEQIFLSSEEIESVIQNFNAPFYRTSAKTGENVEEAFMTTAKMILTQVSRDRETNMIEAKSRQNVLANTLNMIRDEFSEAVGDYQKAQSILNGIFNELGLDMENPSKSGVLQAIDRIEAEEEIYLSPEEAAKNQKLRRFKIEQFS